MPVCPVRGIYFATHFNNFYEAAPAAKRSSDYVEDLGLWGLNSLIVHFPHWQFQGFDDPAAQQSIRHLKSILRAAKGLGLRVGLVEAANDGFKSTPRELLHTPVPDPWGRHGNFGVNLCPSNPKAHELLLRNWRRLLDEFADVGLDFSSIGRTTRAAAAARSAGPGEREDTRSSAANCRPWRVTKLPRVRFILSTWTFDSPPAGEWEGLAECLARDKSWVDYIQADAHEDFPRYPLEKGVPGGLPLLNFPEISMWGQNPWGGYGANPLPGAAPKAVEPDRQETLRRLPLFGRHLRRPQQGDLQPVLLESRSTGRRDDQGVHCLRVFAGSGWRCRGCHRNPRKEPSSRPHQSQRWKGV